MAEMLTMCRQCYAGAGRKALISEISLHPNLDDNGKKKGTFLDAMKGAHFEGSNDGETYTTILDIEEMPEYVGRRASAGF